MCFLKNTDRNIYKRGNPDAAPEPRASKLAKLAAFDIPPKISPF